MATKRPKSFDAKLARIESIARADGDASALIGFLHDEEPVLVGRAATALVASSAPTVDSALGDCLVRLVTREQPDRGCLASEKVVAALLDREALVPDAYHAGLSYVRRERSGIDIVDMAIPVRVGCAMGLMRTSVPEALLDVVPLLADEEEAVRSGAARAIAQVRSEAVAALLHLKVLGGDRPEVMGACFEGLLAVAPERYLATVEAALDARIPLDASDDLGDQLDINLGDEVGDLAAIALGESRLPAARDALNRAIQRDPRPARARTRLIALALMRSDAALDDLFGYLAGPSEALAVHAAEAIAVHRHTTGVAERAHDVAAKRGKRVREAVARQLPRAPSAEHPPRSKPPRSDS